MDFRTNVIVWQQLKIINLEGKDALKTRAFFDARK